ncbi:SMR family transporter [Candidatus Paracaedibacter symbiosus]|uniref:SMR family transporter n=1 Tax=Candidatus Paracaedibacter symbiosus TaxID=244582 RepID=UPI0005099674|nr:SMR family transporter [Candidatus Paracaedibacter symbiosus]
MITTHPYFIVCICVFLNVASQLLLKMGINSIGHFEINADNLVTVGLKAAVNPNIIIGLFLFGLSFILWLVVLSRMEVSLAYPLLSMGYIITPFMSYFLLNETFSLSRILGICVIIVGVYIVSRS